MMVRKIGFFLLALVAGSLSVLGQVLLKNDHELIPLTHLESIRINLVGEENALLAQARMTCSLYKEDYPRTLSLSHHVNVFFISNDQQLEAARTSVKTGEQNIVCFLGSMPTTADWADAIIFLEDASEAQVSRTMQAIFGGSYFYERLSRAVGSYPFGSGLMTSPPIRLSLPDMQRAHFYQPLKDTLEKIMQEGLDSMAYPGAQLLVLHDGEVAVKGSYGYHTYDKSRAVKDGDLYDMASITKVTTATPALMYLYEQKKIDLDKNLCHYFPALCESNKSDIPLREVLTHQGRLQPYIVYWQNTLRKNGKFKGRTFKKRTSGRYPIRITDELYLHKKYKRKIDQAIVDSPLNDEPGYVYSGLTFLLFPELIKELTGERIDSFLYRHYYDPLGASRLTYRPSDHFSLDEIIPTEVDTMFRHQLVHGYVHDEAAAMLDGLSTNAGLFANALDLGKLCQMLLNQGSYGGQRFLKEETIKEFTKYQFADQGNRRGLGFDKPPLEYREGTSYVARSASPGSYGHSGFTGTFFWSDPANKTVFILLTNRVYPTRANSKLYRLGIRPRMHQAIYDFLESK